MPSIAPAYVWRFPYRFIYQFFLNHITLNDKMGVNDEFAEMWMELVMIYFNVLVLNNRKATKDHRHNSEYSS
jgi:hypothetical protein